MTTPFDTNRSRALYFVVLVALFAAAIVLRHVVTANTDVSWLLTVGERVLDGQRLYVDVIETNPPLAVLAYLPGIVMARLLHLSAEIVTDAVVFLCIALALYLCAQILKSSSVLTGARGWPLGLIAFAALAILPTQTFGQREHLALIALLPALAVYAMRGKSETPSRWAIVVAGLCMGLTLMFKPYFAIGILCGAGALAAYKRSLKIFLAPENFIAAALVGVYALVVALVYPDYFTVIGPLVRDVYMKVGISWTALLTKDAIAIWLALLFSAFVLKRRTQIDSTFVLLLAMSFGFALVFLIQRKGFAYHSFPMLALAMLALGYALVTHRVMEHIDRILRGAAIALFAIMFANAMIWFNNAFDAKPLEARVAALGASPKILAITAEPGIGHPLVRALNGTWVSRQQALWVSAYVARIQRDGANDPALEAYAEHERAMLIADIQKNPPTIVLVDDLTGDASAWLRDHADVSALLASYRVADSLNGVVILKRDN